MCGFAIEKILFLTTEVNIMEPWLVGLTFALAGGLIIGGATALLLLANGRIAGISGILDGAFSSSSAQRNWRIVFLGGMLVGAWALFFVMPSAFGAPLERSPLAIVAAGLLVGFGTRLGSGCTSGHGICGLSRFSLRSLVAVISFMVAGMVTVYVTHQLWGWSV